MTRDALNEQKGLLSLLPAILIYIAIGMIVTLIAAFVLALLISGSAIPPASRNMTALCCVPGTFLAGMLTARRAGRRILPMGLLCGGLFFVLLLLISLLFLPDLDTWNGFLGILAACLGGSAAGALCAIGMSRH